MGGVCEIIRRGARGAVSDSAVKVAGSMGFAEVQRVLMLSVRHPAAPPERKVRAKKCALAACGRAFVLKADGVVRQRHLCSGCGRAFCAAHATGRLRMPHLEQYAESVGAMEARLRAERKAARGRERREAKAKRRQHNRRRSSHAKHAAAVAAGEQQAGVMTASERRRSSLLAERAAAAATSPASAATRNGAGSSPTTTVSYALSPSSRAAPAAALEGDASGGAGGAAGADAEPVAPVTEPRAVCDVCWVRQLACVDGAGHEGMGGPGSRQQARAERDERVIDEAEALEEARIAAAAAARAAAVAAEAQRVADEAERVRAAENRKYLFGKKRPPSSGALTK